MICPRCKSEIPEGNFCLNCGRQLVRSKVTKKRGNGQGTVTKRNGKYRATITLGYYWDEDGKKHRKTKSKSFDRKADAVAALATLRQERETLPEISLSDLYKKWEPTHRAGASTMQCYKSAFKYWEPLYVSSIRNISIDELQDILDDCPKGKRTKENMRAVMGLLYKYAIPRKYADLNMAQYLTINAEAGAHRPGFTLDEVEKIKKNVGKVTGADLILCMIYTGFRPSEFLALKGADYDEKRNCLTGGSKTEAGRNRIVTISPKIAHLIPQKAPDELLWGIEGSLKQFTENVFYPALEACGVDNPLSEINGVKRHKYTPHSCRHTFATLLKAVPGADKDKMELIGHASAEMLRYYQDTAINDLRRITDIL